MNLSAIFRKDFLFIYLFIALILGNAPVAQAKIVALFDKDGTLNHDRGSDSAWVTHWLLKRVEGVYTVAQQVPNKKVVVRLTEPSHIEYFKSDIATSVLSETQNGLEVRLSLPDQLRVSFEEYQRIERGLSLATDNEASPLGDVRPFLLDFDPLYPTRERLVLPGYYRKFDATFKYYRASTGGKSKNYILNDYEDAKNRLRIRGPGYTWKGRAFPLFKALMSKPSQIRNVHIFTSRGHRIGDYHAFFDKLEEDGEIAHAKSELGERPVIHSLNLPESRVYGTNLTEKKVTAVKHVLDALYQSAGDRHEEPVNMEGQPVLTKMHTIIVAEDDPAYLEAISSHMFNASGGYLSNQVKLVLFNSGTDEEVAKARFNHRWTVFYSSRKFRAATQSEIDFWTSESNGPISPTSDENCQSLISTNGQGL
jgi:hypothetical protein